MTDVRMPLSGESLDGYLAFRAEHMGLPNVGEIAELVGIDHPAQSRISRSDEPLDDVADLLEVPLSELERLRLPRADEHGRRTFFGASLQMRHLERTRRLFAPAALARSPHHRAIWDLRPFPFDETTSELLGHVCPDPTCLRTQGWNHTNGVDRCDLCGETLATGRNGLVPEGQLRTLRLGLGLVHPDADRRAESVGHLPSDLRPWAPGDLLDLLVALAGTVDPSVRNVQHPWTLRRDAPAGEVCAAMARAWELLTGWPKAFEEHAVELALHTPRGRGDGNRGATVTFLDLDSRATVPAALAALVREERRRLETTGERGGIGAVAASGLRGLRASDLARARRDGTIPVVAAVVRGQFIPMLDRAVVTEMSDRFAESLPLLRAGARLGCGRFGIEQLHAMGFLGEEPLESPITGHEARIRSGALAHLTARLTAASTADGQGWIDLADALCACGGAPKPIGPLVAAMIGGDLPFRLFDGDGPPFHRIRVPGEALPTILRLRFDREAHRTRLCVDAVSKIEAGWELNLKSKHWVEELAAWPNRGTQPAVPVSWLLEAQRTRISCAEIARVVGQHGNGARSCLEALGVKRVGAHMYDRSSFEAVRAEFHPAAENGASSPIDRADSIAPSRTECRRSGS